MALDKAQGWTLAIGLILAIAGSILAHGHLTRAPMERLNLTMQRMEIKIERHLETHKSLFDDGWKTRIRDLENNLIEVKVRRVLDMGGGANNLMDNN